VLHQLGHSFEWFTCNESSRNPEHRRAQQFSFLPQREEWKARGLARIFNPRADEFDAVIANDHFGMYINHPKVVAVMHGFYPDIYGSMPHPPLLKRMWAHARGEVQREGMKRCWKMVTVSERNARILRTAGCRVDRAIPHGIDTRLFSPQSGEEFSTWKDSLLFVGSAAPWKNPEMVRAMAPFWPIAWLGKKPLLHPRIKSLPRVENHEMPLLYSSVAALLHPAFHEGFGYAPLEAMACGTPMVMAATGAGEAIQEEMPECIIQNPSNVEEVKERLSNILRNREEWGKRSRAYVEKHHDWKTWGETWNRLLKEKT
ncbi:MAG: glycosyltransferase family 4 protein, partial [archaeon]